MKSTSRQPPCITLLAVAALLSLGRPGPAAAAEPLNVHADKQGRRIVLDIEARVHAPIEVVWSVLTDYDHMSSFLSAVKSSVVTKREGERLEVAQALETHVAFLTFGAKSVRAVELKPMREIQSSHIGGDFEAFEGRTRIVDQGSLVLIFNHSEYTPKAWLPPLIGPSVIESQTRKQYAQLIDEIVRRAAPHAPAASAAR